VKMQDGDTLLLTGDSITDCDRSRPVGEDSGLGYGYVALVNAAFAAREPQSSIRILNTGISGNRVIHLEDRWQTDVLNLEPDWLSILIGINDVWHQFSNPQDPNQVDLGRFSATYRRLLDQTRPRLKGLILMTPFLIETDRADPMREKMDAYGKAVVSLAEEFEAVLVDVQAAFDRYLLHRPGTTLCDDRVHPNLIGHTIIAEAFRDALGL
jgi:lysophospholipase L1-like esterase